MKICTDVAETLSASMATMILRDSNVFPVSQPRIYLRRKICQTFKTCQNSSDFQNLSEFVRLSKPVRFRQTFKNIHVLVAFGIANICTKQ